MSSMLCILQYVAMQCCMALLFALSIQEMNNELNIELPSVICILLYRIVSKDGRIEVKLEHNSVM